MTRPMGGRGRACLQTVALTLALLCGAAAASPQGRVVAVGDVHGNLNGFVQILQNAKLIDAQRNWVGGNATLVQCGDSIDRGPDMRGVLDFLMALEKQAPRKGGKAITLLGNHEAMNIYGDLRYVTPENFASFADANSEKRRTKAWEQYVEWRKKRALARNQPVPEIGGDLHQQWMAGHPLGFFEHREAFGPDGKYGKWLRERAAILQIGTTAFLHGGIAPELAAQKIDDINKRIRAELNAFDSYRDAYVQQGLLLPFFTLDEIAGAMTTELNVRKASVEAKKQEAIAAGKTYEPSESEMKAIEGMEIFLSFPNWLSIHPAGPLWYRGYATWKEEEGPGQLDRLAVNGISTYVVGHSPQLPGEVRVRFNGRIVLIDTGILNTYYKGGVLSALEIEAGKMTAIYSDRRVALLPAATHKVVGPAADEALKESAEGDLGGGSQSTKPQPRPAAEEKASSASRLCPRPPRMWLGEDGTPLPIQDEKAILDFLENATIVSWKEVGAGINNPKKVVLEKDGIRMHAVFRDVDEEKNEAKMATGRREPFFRDSYIFEMAAYRFSKMLGLDNVPPVVLRKLNGAKGSMQLWVEGTFTETKRQREKIKPPDVSQWNRQVQTMHAFDAIVYNTDRNMGNVLIDKNWKLWMIDHTRAFRRYDELLEPERIVLVNREFVQALRNLQPEQVKAELKPYLRSHEIDGLLARCREFLKFVDKLVAERGEEKALFTWAP